MKKLALLCVLAFGLGCADEGPPKPNVVVTFDDTGKEVTLKRGEMLQIKLATDGEADCFWGCKKAPSTVEFLTEGKEGNNFEFNFKVLESGPITLEYVKFNETGVEKKKDYTINVKVVD
jgi:predicted secreted protein